ncbi:MULTISPECIES: O-antigen polysaccharide polymerase Wzy [Bacteria]|uniref:O-antigen polysaccharide polymerase Wzy n=1 Tax=Bacteria TaxID=2 RepID=UPI003C7CE56B
MSGSRSGVAELPRLDQPRSSLGGFLRGTAALLIAAISVLVAVLAGESWSAGSLALLFAFSFAGLLLAAWTTRAGAGGSAFLYFFVFALFHGGLVFAYAVHGDEALIGGGDNSWITAAQLGPAVVLTTIGVAAATVGVLLGRWRSSAGRPSPLEGVDGARLAPVAITLTSIGAVSVAYAIVTNGGLGGEAGYIEFLELVNGEGAFSYGTLLLGLGLCLMVAARGRARVAGWVAMGVLGAVALPLGLRGPVLFPLLTMVMVEAKRKPLRLWLFGVVAVGVLAMISVIRQTRARGLTGLLEGGWTRIDPLDGAAEMGYSLYPVVQVERWMSSGVEPMNGVTFVAPVVRFVERLFGLPSPPGDQDLRLFNVEIFTRVGPIGGSPIAEGYRNLGLLGVILVMLILGWVMSRVDRLPATAAGAAIAAAVVLPLLTAVRNSFAPILPQLMIGALVLIVAFAPRRHRGLSP